jgi:hypothetical protein
MPVTADPRATVRVMTCGFRHLPRKVVLDKTRAGQFVRKRFEAMVLTALAEELRTGDVAVVGSEDYAHWSEQLPAREAVQETLGSCLVEVGLAEAGESAEFDAKFFRRQLEDKLRGAAAAADSGSSENEGPTPWASRRSSAGCWSMDGRSPRKTRRTSRRT